MKRRGFLMMLAALFVPVRRRRSQCSYIVYKIIHPIPYAARCAVARYTRLNPRARAAARPLFIAALKSLEVENAEAILGKV